ncbi:hypothetical protein H9L17_01840 [Thermomonas brevis]|uniref:DUF3325 domain-containing protein n=1 Tax=Thermomonas brevis TaxID=215691 RepID=A0A7G9QUB2_9GAMM|nr:hypothetical protein [Thermomonas brevis]QNN46937.1 hypothetical protein H9L17_01840 [Thermomonas brevis]
MTAGLAVGAALLCLLGALLLYLASPQQQLRAAGPWPARRPWWPGIACLLLSLLLFLQVLAPVEAVAGWSVLAMLVWSLLPFLGAWRARVRAGRTA